MVGLVSYGTYIPFYRLQIADIALAWNKDPEEVTDSFGVVEKSVPAVDEDAVTLAFEAAHGALEVHDLDPARIGCVFVGSESHPYAVNPTSTIVAELLGIGHRYLATDTEFACKAATAGIQAIAGLLGAGQFDYGLSVGADCAQSKPHDSLEYTAAAAGAACLMGTDNVAAELVAYTSYSSDTPDFWRRDGIRYPSHAGRFTGEPAYFAHVMAAARDLLAQTHLQAEQIDYCVFHMPNGKFPAQVARRLGFTRNQLAPSLTIDYIGNPYTASALLGLAATLDIAGSGKTIFMVSYGSGAGSDAFLWKTTSKLKSIRTARQQLGLTVKHQIHHKQYISYIQYLKHTRKI